MYFHYFFQVGHGETDFENDEVHEKWCHVAGGLKLTYDLAALHLPCYFIYSSIPFNVHREG